MCLLCVLDRQVQLERGDPAAQELVNSLQVLEVMAGAMAAELKPLVRLQSVLYCTFMLPFPEVLSLIVIPIASYDPVKYWSWDHKRVCLNKIRTACSMQVEISSASSGLLKRLLHCRQIIKCVLFFSSYWSTYPICSPACSTRTQRCVTWQHAVWECSVR